jgi:hypothetical protein
MGKSTWVPVGDEDVVRSEGSSLSQSFGESTRFPSLVPYLKGIHLTLDSWQPGRDSEGWRVSNQQVTAHLDLPDLSVLLSPHLLLFRCTQYLGCTVMSRLY